MEDVLNQLRKDLAGRYEVEQELGHGGMAVVYLAKDLRHDRRVAIKVLRQDVGGASAERFLREIRTVAALHHPHILQLLDSGTAGDHLFYVMPYVEGETIRQRLERDGPLPIDEAVRIAREVADGLAFAHTRGIVHRDIKPENIFLSAGHALVADFGIARAAQSGVDTTLTDAGLAVGTPSYMSPEQATAEPKIDGRSDQYALGCVLYEMLAGAPPFTGPTSQVIMARHTADPVPPLRTVRAVPPAIETAIVKALAKVPADRWQTIREFADAFGEQTTLVTAKAVRRRWQVPAVAGVIAVLASAVVLLQDGEREADARPAVQRLAILPFAFSGDSQWSDLATGLSEALYTAFTHVEGLAPIGGGRTLSYAGRASDPREVARELGVGAVVSADVRVVGNRVRVTTQLTNVGDRPVVREEFNADLVVDGKLLDLFELQDTLKVKILASLQVRLTDANRSAVTRGVLTTSDTAYRLFLSGRKKLQNLTPDGARLAAQLFQQALEHDTSFADAWAGLAEAYSTLYQLDAIRPADVQANLRAAAEKAIRLDPSNAYALSLKGFIRATYDWDWEGGIQDIQEAVRIAPSSPDAWFMDAVMKNLFGKSDSAIISMHKAVSLDPTNPFLLANLGFRFRMHGVADSAIWAWERSLAMDSTQWLPRMFLADAYGALGERSRADRMAEAVLKAAGDSQPFMLAGVAEYYGNTGQFEAAKRTRDLVERIAKRQYVPGCYLAQARFAAGDTLGALSALESSVNERDLDVSWWLVVNNLSALRHPRLERLRQRVFKDRNVIRGLPPLRRGAS